MKQKVEDIILNVSFMQTPITNIRQKQLFLMRQVMHMGSLGLKNVRLYRWILKTTSSEKLTKAVNNRHFITYYWVSYQLPFNLKNWCKFCIFGKFMKHQYCAGAIYPAGKEPFKTMIFNAKIKN